MDSSRTIKIYCNGVSQPRKARSSKSLQYLKGIKGQNVNINLPSFVKPVYHLPNRILDLLEIAAYLFAGDRLTDRGDKYGVMYQKWSRNFEYHIKVRDFRFWNKSITKSSLCEALVFMTGDASYTFKFYPGHSTPPTNLFDQEGFSLEPSPRPISITLFSGGLDSLAGVLKLLSETKRKLILVSHHSQTGTVRTQVQLVKALKEHYPNRIYHLPFECCLKGARAAEETQRTRSFLYTSIGYAIASAYGLDEMSVFENGVTSINFQRREDLLNARASRTTHPQTIKRLEHFYSLFSGKPFTIHLPFLLKTKQDILDIIRDGPHAELIPSTVSCSRTYKNLSGATHCGECFQCVDRLIATYGAQVEDWDAELYAADIINEDIQSSETRTIVVDYLRQAMLFAESNVDHFFESHITDLSELVDYLPGTKTENEAIDLIWKLTRAHGNNVSKGIQRIRKVHDNPYKTLVNRSLIGLISQREHLKPEVKRLVESIIMILGDAIPEMFRSVKPKDEPDFNNKVHSLLSSHELKIRTEHPTLSFACAKVIPDHLILESNLLIEAKYIRGNTSPSKANEGMASDLIKYPQDKHILFLVYDPDHKIPADVEFINDFESRGRCSVKILR